MLVKIISTMLRNTYTTDEFVERLGLMRKFYNKRLFADGEGAVLRDVLRDDCDERTLAVLEDWLATFTEDSIQPLVIYEALDSIQEDMMGLPAVTLYVPIRFAPEETERFGKWFRENIQPNILISLRIDPRATGGCSFIWKDVFYDFSLKYFIDKQREDIVASFNKYTHAK